MLLTFSVHNIATVCRHDLVWKIRTTDCLHALPDQCVMPFESRVTPLINKNESEIHSLCEEALSVVQRESENKVCQKKT
jgi:hypothetical protein